MVARGWREQGAGNREILVNGYEVTVTYTLTGVVSSGILLYIRMIMVNNNVLDI